MSTARRADATRNADRIIDAARRLLTQDPHAGMEAIAQAAGVTRMTVNRHFKTRENLVAAVYQGMLDRAVELLHESDIETGSPREALTRLVSSWVGTEGWTLPTQLTDQAHLAPELQAHYYEEQLGAPLLKLMDRGRAAGDFNPDMPAQWMARLLGGVLRTALDSVADGTVTPTTARTLAVRSLLAGLGASPTTP